MEFNRTTFSPVYDFSKLRGRIRQMCNTEQNFARKIGRTQNFLTKVFKSETYFDAKDIDRASEVLAIELEEIGDYFFTLKVCNTET